MTLSLFPAAAPAAEEPEERGALLSPCGTFRYLLWRRRPGRQVLWCMLNPSTADADQDDPTIRRCRGYTRAWGYAGFSVVNLCAYRATDPADLYEAARARGADVVGPDTDRHIVEAVGAAALVVCAWGANARDHRPRRDAVIRLLRGAGARLHILALTKHAEPVHPLMQAGDLTPQPWEP